ncbi:unnamed protein product [Lymnaea stagnalis]|uniref:Uncharacterized protein n=1 Tax=Lymnaea stagnalis TaxID=6523 RepID=A0AAV2H6F9_LYMST
MQLLYVIFILIICSYSGYCMSIELLGHIQNTSITNCEKGLINTDVVVSKFDVNYSQEDPSPKFAQFYIRTLKDDGPNLLEDDVIDLEQHCTSDQDSKCFRTGPDRVIITIKLKGSTNYSGASIHAKIVTSSNEEDIKSPPYKFPDIHDSSEVDLSIDGKRTSEIKIFRNLTSPETTVAFVCESKVKPCWIQISEDNKVLSENKDLINFVVVSIAQGNRLLTITYGCCSLKGYVKTILYYAHGDFSESKVSNYYLLFILVFPVVAIIIIIIIVKWDKIKTCYKKLIKKNQDWSERHKVSKKNSS